MQCFFYRVKIGLIKIDSAKFSLQKIFYFCSRIILGYEREKIIEFY